MQMVSESAFNHVHVSYPRNVTGLTHIGSRYFVGRVYAIGADMNPRTTEGMKHGGMPVGIWQPQVPVGGMSSVAIVLGRLSDLRVRVTVYFSIVMSLAIANLYLIAANQLPYDLVFPLAMGIGIAMFIVVSFAVLLLREA